MPIPERVLEILNEIGQAATEVPCGVEGCREFVSVYRWQRMLNDDRRFPYFSNEHTLYRVIRFRTLSELIENDVNIGPADMWDLQAICVADEDLLERILVMWLGDLTLLGRPVDCAIPV